MGKDPWSNWTILNAEEICWSVTSVISQKCLLDLCMLVLFTLAVCGSCYLRKKMLYFASQKSRWFVVVVVVFCLFFLGFFSTSRSPLLTFSTFPSEMAHFKHSSIFGLRAILITRLWAKPKLQSVHIRWGNAPVQSDHLRPLDCKMQWFICEKHYIPLQC